MSGFVDATDPAAVEQVLTGAVEALGLPGLLEQLADVPGLRFTAARAGGLLRAATPAVLEVGDQVIAVRADGSGELRHVVGGVVLSHDPISRHQLAGALAPLLVRAVSDSGGQDQLSVQLTAMRDAIT